MANQKPKDPEEARTEALEQLLNRKNGTFDVDLQASEKRLTFMKDELRELKRRMSDIKMKHFEQIKSLEDEAGINKKIRNRVGLFAQYMVIGLLEFAIQKSGKNKSAGAKKKAQEL